MMMILFLIFLIPLCFFSVYWEIMNLLLLSFYLFFSKTLLVNYFSNISYSLGGDIVSWSMVFLSFWIIILMFLSGFKVKRSSRVVEFLILIIFLLLFLVLCFMSVNAFMFYVYFEAVLVPTLFFIFGWGYQPERLIAGFYLLFYTMFASLPLLLSLSYLGLMNGSFFWFYFDGFGNFYLYLSLILAFLVSMPIFIFHFWLPKAHVEAPVFGSMILAGVLLKLGGYGLIRVLSFMYKFCVDMSLCIVSFSMLGVIITGFLCLLQVDIKCLIAYSSVAHMGVVVCGLFTFNVWGLIGSLILMLGHGLCSSGMFVLANIIYDRSCSRSLFINKGLISVMPSLSLMWFLLSVSNMSSPPSLNLLGELFLFNSIISWSSAMTGFLMLSSFLSCCYSIYLYCMINHGCSYSGLLVGSSVNVREYLLVMMHWIPLNLFIFKFDIFLFL